MSERRDATAYKDAGVDLSAAEDALDRIRRSVESTRRPEVLHGFGGFGGAIRVPSDVRDPVIVSSVDSVGTKVSVAVQAGRYGTVGADLVNHCANDVLVTGALPLAFLDYFAASNLDPNMCGEVVEGAAAACRALECSLIGGETAELPGVYREGQFDLAGCMIGIAPESELIDINRVEVGDAVVALPSNGLHTNGYSLVRRVFAEFDLSHTFPELGRPLVDELLAIHRPYVHDLRHLLPKVRAMAHVTGGGLIDNIPRVLPEGLGVDLEWGAWQVPAIFELIEKLANVEFNEMCRVFNMGIGMAVICSRDDVDSFVRTISGASLAGSVRLLDGDRDRVRILR